MNAGAPGPLGVRLRAAHSVFRRVRNVPKGRQDIQPWRADAALLCGVDWSSRGFPSEAFKHAATPRSAIKASQFHRKALKERWFRGEVHHGVVGDSLRAELPVLTFQVCGDVNVPERLNMKPDGCGASGILGSKLAKLEVEQCSGALSCKLGDETLDPCRFRTRNVGSRRKRIEAVLHTQSSFDRVQV